jgi:ribonuclease-3
MASRHRTIPEAREQAVARLCERFGLPPTLPRLQQALVHPSFRNEAGADPGLDNQRLEFLGDSVLALCVGELLMAEFPGAAEGELTVMRAALVNAEALAAVAAAMGLGQALRLGRGADATGERKRPNVLADALEAVVGAVFLDGGLDAARRLTGELLADGMAALRAQGGIERDPKSRLQERLQARGAPPPCYEVVAAEGPAHRRSFDVIVTVEPEPGSPVVAGRGQGSSKKLAAQAAARAALAWLGPEGEAP